VWDVTAVRAEEEERSWKGDRQLLYCCT
jgi:hypothetical protein